MEMSGLAYLAAAGETADQIALKVYGDERYAAEILQANPSMIDKAVLEGGEEIALPVVVVPEKNGVAPWKAPWKN